jgi:CubicO group peptidase (beta-lactamase class C family)
MGTTVPDRFAGVAELIQRELVERSLPSLALAVVEGGEIVWEAAWGWADRERRVPATPHTMYSLASVSKPIAATGLMRLVERGVIDLGRPVNDYLGDSPLRARVGRAEDATVRRVANHTSGLPLHYQFFPDDEPDRRPPMSETIHRYGNLVTAPGERYQYSNLGYGILDHLIARHSGKSFVDFMRQEVFLPLGMTRSSVDIGPGLEELHATRYAADGSPLAFYDFDHPGASAVYGSAHDLARFALLQLGALRADQKAILKPETLHAMREPTADAGDGNGYGIGIRSREDVPGARVVGHNGGMAGVSTTLELIPSRDLAVVALTNASNGFVYTLPEKIFNVLLPGYTETAERARSERKEAATARHDEPLPGELRGEWIGSVSTYEGERALQLRFQEDGDVHARIADGLWTLVNEPKLRDGRLTGKMLGDIGTTDAARRSYHLHLDLAFRGDRIEGAVIAVSLPSRRPGNALSYWTELKR